MTIEEIKKLIEVVRETGIAELEVKFGDDSVRIRSGVGQSKEFVVPTVLPVSVPSAPTLAAVQSAIPVEPAAITPPPPPAPPQEEDTVVVKSPIVGTYYDSPAPGSASFVKVGDTVEPKQVLCIIESMKLMNEIEAEAAGVIVAKHVENGRPVEYGEALFTFRPR